jgi:hypothetical protein
MIDAGKLPSRSTVSQFISAASASKPMQQSPTTTTPAYLHGEFARFNDLSGIVYQHD